MVTQKEKLQRGIEFQEEMRKSWLTLSNLWRLRIDDSSGSRPGDSLILTNYQYKPLNILIEYKRKMEPVLRLSDLRESQIKGLADFDKVAPWHHSLIIVNFLDEEKSINDTYAVTYYSFIKYLNVKKKLQVSAEEIKSNLDYYRAPVLENVDGTKRYHIGGILPWLASM